MRDSSKMFATVRNLGRVKDELFQVRDQTRAGKIDDAI